jgi:formylglycine-generating enzyme required for sulfatase activity
MMGSEDGDYDERPAHEVCLDAFWLAQTETTNAQYKVCVDAGVCDPPGDRTRLENPGYANRPVVYVDWYRAQAYSEWLGGSLPTEAQWEYAARGPAGNIYPWGNVFNGQRLNFCDVNCGYESATTGWNDRFAGIAPVGQYVGGASWVGALDMSGNAWEWVLSAYREYPYNKYDGRNNDSINSRVLRGGSFTLDQWSARAASRGWSGPLGISNCSGFRPILPASAFE